jgi:hypothetical protein
MKQKQGEWRTHIARKTAKNTITLAIQQLEDMKTTDLDRIVLKSHLGGQMFNHCDTETATPFARRTDRRFNCAEGLSTYSTETNIGEDASERGTAIKKRLKTDSLSL